MHRRWLLNFSALILATLACSVGASTPSEQEMLAAFEQTPTLAVVALAELSATPELAAATVPATVAAVMEPTQPAPTVTAAAVVDAVPQAAEIAALGETYIYAVQLGSSVAMPNWSHPADGCNWLGVAGQLFALDGVPTAGTLVEAGGILEGQPVLGLSLTGLIDIYGPGSYEIKLADHTVASLGQVWVQVKGAAGESLSPQVLIDTYNDCGQNLILLNFVQVAPYNTDYQIYLPWVVHTQP